MPILVFIAGALMLALPFWLAGPAQAVPVSFAFSGMLDQVDQQLRPPPMGLSDFQVGNPFFGSFTYESSTMPIPGGDVSGSRSSGVLMGNFHYNALTDFRVTIHVAPSSLAPNSEITFTTILSSPSGAANSVVINLHEFQAQVRREAGLSGSNILFPVDSAIVLLQNFNATVFGLDVLSALPTSLDPSQFDRGVFALNFGDRSAPFSVSGQFLGGPTQPQPLILTVLEPVPEPATLLLFGTTMAGLGLTARWRRRKQQ